MTKTPRRHAAVSSFERIYRIVGRIPRGRVATYGQVAKLAGLPNHARQVGYAMHALGSDSSVPWHRVLNRRGEVSERALRELETVQRALLEAEGVAFDPRGRVDLSRAQWRPRQAGAKNQESG